VPSALEQVRQILAIPIKKTDTKLVAYLTLDEMQAILNVPTLAPVLEVRDRAMLDVLLCRRSPSLRVGWYESR
jgi:integrase/recombinase XerD